MSIQPERLAALRLLLKMAAPERRHLLLGIGFLLLAAGCDVLVPILGKSLIDQHLLPRDLDWPRMACLLAGCWLGGCCASWLRYRQLLRLAGLAMRSVRRLREAVFAHVLGLPVTYFDRALTGQLVSRVTNDTEAVKTLYIQILFVLLDSGILLIGTVLAMAWLDWRLMLIALTLLPAVTALVFVYQRWSGPAVSAAREWRSKINAQVAETIGGIALLQAQRAVPRFAQRFDRVNRAHRRSRLEELRANAWLLRPALDLLNISLVAAAIFSVGTRAVGTLEVGILYAFVSYVARMVEPLVQITMQFSQLQQALVATARVDQLLREPRVTPIGGALEIGAGALTLDAVRFAYAEAQPVLHDLSLTIPAGGFYAIVGPTGSGKSTLLSLLLRFYAAQSGSIAIDGIALAELADSAFRQAIGLVPQEPFLLAASAAENIDMGRGLPFAQIESAARDAGADDFIRALEQGYATQLGEGGALLATGEKQLLAIARALAGQPRILLLDEATAHIDSATEQVVQQALQRLRGRVTLIAIAHRLSTVRDADCIVVLNHGHIVERGSHQELMALKDGMYQRLYLLQQLAD